MLSISVEARRKAKKALNGIINMTRNVPKKSNPFYQFRIDHRDRSVYDFNDFMSESDRNKNKLINRRKRHVKKRQAS